MDKLRTGLFALVWLAVLLGSDIARCQYIKGVKSAPVPEPAAASKEGAEPLRSAFIEGSQNNDGGSGSGSGSSEGVAPKSEAGVPVQEPTPSKSATNGTNGNGDASVTASVDNKTSGDTAENVKIIEGADPGKANAAAHLGASVQASEINLESQMEDIMEDSLKEQKTQESNLYFLQMLAFISSIFMQLTSLPTIIKIYRKKSTGELDGLAYVMIFYSSFLWFVYGLLIENTTVVLPNISGLLLGFLYTSVYHRHCKNLWMRHKLFSYYKTCGLVSFLLYLFIYFMTFDQYVLSVGLLASISSVINFGAPLSSLRDVIKNKDTQTMPVEMSVGSLICSFLWFLYGAILRDWFLIIPNLGGMVLGLIQVFLIAFYAKWQGLQFVPDDSTFKAQKDSYRPDGMLFPDLGDYENRLSDVSTNVQESFVDFTYDETSPLTSDAHFMNAKRGAGEPDQQAGAAGGRKIANPLKNINSIEQDTVLTL